MSSSLPHRFVASAVGITYGTIDCTFRQGFKVLLCDTEDLYCPMVIPRLMVLEDPVTPIKWPCFQWW